MMLPLRIWQLPFALSQLLVVASGQSETTSLSASFESTSTSTTISETDSAVTATATQTGGPRVHTVQAGMGGFTFSPKELKDVQKGDIVTFEFFPPDHSVARAEFGSPCVPYEYTGKDKQGFWSDIQWVDSVSELTYWNLTINDTSPIFYYCAAPGSCIEQQMIGVINPNSTQTFEAQESAAKKATIMVKPGDPIPKEGTATLQAPGASSTSSPNEHQSSGRHISKSVIIGASVGGVLFLVVCAALFFYVGRTKTLKEAIERKDATVSKAVDTTPRRDLDFGPLSPGYMPQSPYSPDHMTHSEYGNLPPYVQSPDGRSPHASMAHMSMMSQNRLSSMYAKQDANINPAYTPVGLGSPGLREQGYLASQGQTPRFTAELEAPLKSPR